mmetsp:Transcript_2303/g.4037  ORF Transcript_2303/g.4037 Transcript_2303/m.4037 type:complete len:185 (+) Transcript_2303:67-621(+)
MFKKFSNEESISGRAQIKSSAQRAIRGKLEEQMIDIHAYLDDILPKKDKMVLIKCSDHINIVATTENPSPLFFNIREGPYYPSLRLLHKYPFLLPAVQVDRGAIRHVMRGSDIMCPGLTSAGGKLPEELGENTVVAVMAEGKQHAVGIGRMKMSAKEIVSVNKGVAIENVHHLGDGLWKTQEVA